MTLAIDATSTTFFSGGPGTTFNTSTITVGSGANRALIALVVLNGAPTGLTATWDSGGTNQAMTLLGTQSVDSGSNQNVLAIFGLVAPTPGANVLAVSWTGSCYADLYSYSVTGADQAGGVTTFPNFTSATGATQFGGVTQTSATGNISFAIYSDPDQTVSSTNDTTPVIDNGASGNYAVAFGYQAGAPSVTHTVHLAGTSIGWAAASVDIAALSGGGSPFSANVSDTTATSDSVTPAEHGSGSLSDTTATSDAVTPAEHGAGSLSDTAATSDAVSPKAHAAPSDTTATSDSVTPAEHGTASVSDTSATSDALTQIGKLAASPTDTAATSDALTPNMKAVASAAPPIALIAHTDWAGNGNFTSSAVNTTGADFLALVASKCQNVTDGAPTITDSYGNTWLLAVQSLDNPSTLNVTTYIYYAVNPTVGTGHTFTSTAVNGYASQQMAAFSGVATSSPLSGTPTSSQAGGTSTPTIQAGSVTPAVSGSLIIAANGNFSSAGAGTVSVDSGFTLEDKDPDVQFVNAGSALAYLVQGSAGAVNPTWTISGNPTPFDYSAVTAVFAPGASASGLADTAATSDSASGSLGGGSYSGTATDTTATSDAVTPSLIGATAPADTSATSDALTPAAHLPASLADTTATSDSVSASLVGLFTTSVADTAATSDSVTGAETGSGSVSDTVATSDQASDNLAGLIRASISDTVTTSDSLTTTLRASASVADTAGASDDTWLPQSLADTVATSDAVHVARAFPIADTVATSDGVTNGPPGTTILDTVATSDGITANMVAVSSAAASIALVTQLDWAGNGFFTSTDSATPGYVDTTGADLLVIVAAKYMSITDGTPAVSDNYGNTWILAAQSVDDPTTYHVTSYIFYVANPVVGPGHTFEVVSVNGYGSQQMAAFRGVATSSPLGVTNNNQVAGITAPTIQPGSVTPTVPGSLIISACGNFSTGGSGTVSVDSGLTITNSDADVYSVNVGSALAYRVMLSAVPIDPTWSIAGTTTPVDFVTAIAAFAPLSGGGLSDVLVTSDHIGPPPLAPLAVSDTAATSDVVAGGLLASPTLVDTVATSDAVTGHGSGAGSASDTTATADTISGAAKAVATLADSLATADGIVVNLVIALSLMVSDTVATSDALTPALRAPGIASDTTATSDAVAEVGRFGFAIADTSATSDLATTAVVISVTITDTAASSDAPIGGGHIIALPTDTVATSDTTTPAGMTNGALNDTAATSDAVTGAGHFPATLNDTAVSSDAEAITTAFRAAVADTIASSDALSASAKAVFLDSVTTSDAVSSAMAKIMAIVQDHVASSDVILAYRIVTTKPKDAVGSAGKIYRIAPSVLLNRIAVSGVGDRIAKG